MARIKLKYINAFVNRDRKNSRVRYYFRRRGSKAIPLRGLPGSEEFMAAYAAALAGVPDVEIGVSRALPGTISALVVAYYGSDEWHKLAADTQKNRRRIIERFRVQHGNKRVALLEREHILGMLAAIERPSAKRHWLKAIRGLLRAAVPTMRRDDPTEGIAGIKMPKTKGHHTWTDEEIAQYRAYWPLGTQQRLVMEFAPLLTGCRYSELTNLSCVDFNTDSDTLTIRLAKGGSPRHVVLTSEGRKLFISWTAGRPANMHIFIRDDGQPWGRSHQQRPLIDASEIAKISPPVTFHVLRHSHASHLAMKGVGLGVIAAQLGHADTRMTEKHYAHLAPSYVADTIRANFPNLGIVGDTAVTSISRRDE